MHRLIKKNIIFYLLVISFVSQNPLLSKETKNEKELLQIKLKTAKDIEKSAILNKLAKAYWWDKDKNLCLKYATEALKYAKKFKQEKEKLYSLISLSHIHRRMKSFKIAEKFGKKALKLAKRRNNSREILDVLISYEKIFEFKDKTPNLKKIEYYCKKIVEFASELKERKIEALYNHVLGGIYIRLKKEDKSLEHYKRALELYKRTKNKSGEVHILTYLSAFNRKKKRLKEAFENLMEAESIAKKNNLKEKLCRIYSAFWKLYYVQGLFDDAEKYCLKEYKIAKEIKNFHWIFGSSVRLVDLYLLKNSFKQEIEGFVNEQNSIIKTNKYLKTREYYNFFLLNNARLEHYKKNLKSAYYKYLESIVYAKKNNNILILFRTYLNLALFHLNNKKIGNAKKMIHKSKKLLRKIDNLFFIELYENLKKRIGS